MERNSRIIKMYIADKQIVKNCFQKNFSTYNKQAVVQKQIASKLINLLVKNKRPHFKKIIEIGCGTGFLTENILKNCQVQEYIINDLTSTFPESIKHLGKERNFNDFIYTPGDAERIEFPGHVDAVFSTSTFQWFHNLENFITRANKLLNDNGIFSFSTFGEENFKEIKTILDLGLNYKTLSELTGLVELHFDIIHASEWKQKEIFQNPKEVLKHIKYTGVNGVKKSFIGRDKLVNFEHEYLKLFSNEDQSVNLTYHPIIIIARKKRSKQHLMN